MKTGLHGGEKKEIRRQRYFSNYYLFIY